MSGSSLPETMCDEVSQNLAVRGTLMEIISSLITVLNRVKVYSG